MKYQISLDESELERVLEGLLFIGHIGIIADCQPEDIQQITALATTLRDLCPDIQLKNISFMDEVDSANEYERTLRSTFNNNVKIEALAEGDYE